MSKLGRHRKRAIEDVDIDLVPIMNMFLVLIPFLLMSACFFQLKAINTSVPVLSEAANDVSKKEKLKVTVIVQIEKDRISLSAISDSVRPEELDKWGGQMIKGEKEAYPLDEVSICLQKIKESYPASDTVIVIPGEDVIYDTIIQTMDVARFCKSTPLFPNVVLSGKVG